MGLFTKILGNSDEPGNENQAGRLDFLSVDESEHASEPHPGDTATAAEQSEPSFEAVNPATSPSLPASNPAALVLEAILENVQDAIYFKDRNSRFVLINTVMAVNTFALADRAQAIGRTDFDFFTQEHAKSAFEMEQKIIASGIPVIGVEEKETWPDGRVTWALTSKFPFKDDCGAIIGTWGISRDITAQKNAEDELKTSQEKLRHSQKMEAFGQLAGGIAHDFNNMLGVILGSAQLVELQIRDAHPDLKNNVNMLIDSAKRAADLTQQLLAFARKDNYKIVSLDMNDVIRSVIGLLRHTIDKRIRIEERLAAKSATIMGDYMQLQNALLNLALNARDAMPGNGTLTFATDVAGPGEDFTGADTFEKFLRIQVADTGSGMDEKTKMRIFEPFFTTKGPGKGTGLGLASVYGTIKNHHGLIEVESELKKGTTFTMYLPLHAVSETDSNVEQKRAQKGTGRVLVIDDEEDLRTIVAELIENLGYSVVTARDGIEGVEYFKRHFAEIDVIIVDMIMPRMSGYDCIKILKRINPEARILVSSGYSLVSDTQHIIAKGIAGFIQKPFEMSELSQALFDALNRNV